MEEEKRLFSKILIPSDSRETVDLVINFARQLLTPNGEITVLNVIDATHPLEVIDRWKHGTKISIAAVEAGYRNGVRVIPEVKNARSITGCIVEEIRSSNFDLLLLTVRRHPRRSSFRFGSKTRALARNAPCDVLMISQLALTMGKKTRGSILVACRNDGEGRRALQIASLLSYSLNGMPLIQYRILSRSERREYQQKGIAGDYRIFAKAYYGKRIADAILQELSKERYSLLVVSSNITMSALPFYAGGTFETLVKNSPCPVVIFRAAQ